MTAESFKNGVETNSVPTRMDILRKLLSFGDMHRSDIVGAMGGDPNDTDAALRELESRGELRHGFDSYSRPVIRLTPPAQARAFAEVTVVTRRLVEVINFTEETA